MTDTNRSGRAQAWGTALVLGGLFAGTTLDLARVLGFLPFFVLGLHATPERLERWRAVPVRCGRSCRA